MQQGDKVGREIGFPTLNLDPLILPKNTKQGVYATTLLIHDHEYKGALYFGPRLVLQETKNVLEIFVLDFDKEIYGEIIQFVLGAFIRPVENFSSLGAMTKQLKKDIAQIRSLS